MATVQEELRKIGLADDEVRVYLAALEIGPATVLEIARKTSLNRTTLYAVTERLMEKRLLGKTVQGKRTLYVAEPPEKIVLLLKERLASFDALLPELISLSHHGVYKPKITYIEGLSGIKDVYRASLLSKEKTVYAFVGVERLNVRSNALQAFWEGEYRLGRQKSAIAGKVIVPDNAEGRTFKTQAVGSDREIRLVPATTSNFEGEVLLYDNVVAFISYTEDEEFALSLESKAIARTLRMVWQIVWNVAY